MQLAIDIYHMLGQVAERGCDLRYEHTICDLLYHLKYMYVGDFVKTEADIIIQRLPLSMQEKLRFITHQPVDAIHAAAAATNSVS